MVWQRYSIHMLRAESSALCDEIDPTNQPMTIKMLSSYIPGWNIAKGRRGNTQSW